MHDDNPVANAHNLRQLGRHDDNRLTHFSQIDNLA